MVRAFIGHVLGIDSNHLGLYGNTSAYYGTVEQQGQLTLHLHMLLWIANALSPKDIQDRLMKPDGAFQQEMINYLESVHVGQFLTGSKEEVRQKVPHNPKGMTDSIAPDAPPGYKDPTQTLPTPAPPMCSNNDCKTSCLQCKMYDNWSRQFNLTVDDLILRSNVHNHKSTDSKKLKTNKNQLGNINNEELTPDGPKGCMNKHGICTARFPCKTFSQSSVDLNDRRIDVKKLEPMINNVMPELTYVMRCNTDVTSLSSGTSIKAIVLYISDYVTKLTLKTHQIFSSTYDVFQKNPDLFTDDHKPHEAGRSLVLKVVNSLSTKLEIGSPMASLYLLGNNDHYTSHKFIFVSWRGFVSKVRMAWEHENKDSLKLDPEKTNLEKCNSNEKNDFEDAMDIDEKIEYNIKPNQSHIQNLEDEESVEIKKEFGRYIGKTRVDDYIYRPFECSNMNLYEWVQCSNIEKRSPKQTKEFMELMLGLSNSNDCEDNNNEDYIHANNDTKPTYTNLQSSNALAFMPEHPQYISHAVRCDLNRRSYVVPNFAGGTLPRCDQGDREYYCSTMLTLFAPWRDGKDLKKKDQSWDSAFRAYAFTLQQKKLMENFNLRYECLDARDDFNLLMKAEQKMMENSISHDNTHWINLEDDHDDIEGNDYEYDLNTVQENYTDLGPMALRRKRNEKEIDNILKASGWLDKFHINYAPDSFKRITPELLSRPDWNNLVASTRKAISDLRMKYLPIKSTPTHIPSTIEPNDVQIVGAEFFLKDYQIKESNAQAIVEDIIIEFSLNEEQERAFRTVANHASSLEPPPLKMCLAGMGGTGKTQVIKALISMFERRNESHRFIVVAPTGNAAASIGGTTYHSMFGIRIDEKKGNSDNVKNQATLIAEARMKLRGVEYIFIDELSMVSCREFYAICARLCEIYNKPEIAFGGVNMIVAGDFAQLPPVGGNPLYRRFSKKEMNSKQSEYEQLSILGLIYWHQFTTVVILRKNMRQKYQSPEDTKLRTCLENMRYASCTKEDLDFLYTRVAGREATQPHLTDPKFRNVPIITAWNVQKDRINDVGALRFANDTGQTLSHFYSIDSIATVPDKRKRGLKPGPPLQAIKSEMRHALWNAGPATSQHFAGKLSLCIGMPVMIRNNDATELCITKGQEATVVGWNAIKGPEDVEVLDTLFLKLSNPPKDVNIPGLPINVIPMTRSTLSICASLPNDTIQYIKQEQVQILPCFAMTDFSAQGKTRPYNLVELMHAKTHLSYYTALSRSATADGTVIIQGFDPNKITRGIRGELRQEFRDLNILDEMSKMRYQGSLPKHIIHPMRNPTIRAYRLWKNNTKDDEHANWHNAIKWKGDEDVKALAPVDDIFWNPVLANQLINNIKHDLVTKKNSNNKRHRDDKTDDVAFQDFPKKKKQCRRNILHQPRTPDPVGPKWDNCDYSCAYDAIIAIIRNIWSEDPDAWSIHLSSRSVFLNMLAHGLQQSVQNICTLETARNNTRTLLRQHFPNNYPPPGHNFTDITLLLQNLLACATWTPYTWKCSSCNYTDIRPGPAIAEHISIALTERMIQQHHNIIHISSALNERINGNALCPHCFERSQSHTMQIDVPFQLPPHIMFIGVIETNPYVLVDHNLIISHKGSRWEYKLKGAIYFGNNHFTCRLIDHNEVIWFHDGIATGNMCQKVMRLTDVPTSQWWNTCGSDKTLSYVIYILRDNIM